MKKQEGFTGLRGKLIRGTMAVGVLGGMALAFPAVAQADASPGPAIIGGNPASQDYSFIAAIDLTREDGTTSFHCGGSLIDPQWIVTEAHCASDQEAGTSTDPSLLHVRVGSLDRTSGGSTAEVDKVVVNPEWFNLNRTVDSDIALLHLDHAVDEKPVELADTGTVDSAVRVLGWGQTSNEDTTLPTGLREIDTTVAKDEKCIDGGELQLTTGDVCLNNPHGTDGPCYGDSGSPGIQWTGDRWVLVGNDSRSLEELCGTTGEVLTGMPYFHDWITSTIS